MNQGSVSSWVPAISEVLNVITQEVKCISGPGLGDLSDSELEDLHFESSLEIEQVAGEITRLMAQNQSIGSSITTCLSKTYVKASIHRMATQTRRKFYPAAAAQESRGSLHIVVDEVWDVLLKEDGGDPEEGEEVCVVQKFKDTVPARIPELTRTLADLLFEFGTSSCSWHHFASAAGFGAACHSWQIINDGTVTVPEFHAEMKIYIQDASRSFLTMMISWMNHRVQVHSDRVQLAITEASSAPPPQVPEVLVEEEREPLGIRPKKCCIL
ncbi:hypothetical protein KUCAC02_036121 [Chaenocephalus aceratus]|nr:hypothetical protein KUCAC02_036121 [Chaenocephalus aceratus]